MKATLVLLATSFIILSGSSSAMTRDHDETPTITWAKQIGHDFVQGMLKQEKSAYGLLSPEMHAIHKDITSLYREWFHYSSIAKVRYQVAPDNSEVIMLGILEPDPHLDKNISPGPTKFTIRIAKEANGRWSIRYLKIVQKAGVIPVPPG